MKFVNKILLILTLAGLISACDMWDLDQQTDPNQLDESSASLEELYNSVQLAFADQYTAGDYAPGAMARMYLSVSFTYQAALPNTSMNGVWSNAYAELFPDVDALIKKAEGSNFGIHVGSAKVLKAWTMMQLVDLMDAVPMSKAGQGVVEISPDTDTGSEIYAAALILLDSAVLNLGAASAPTPASDMFYGGDSGAWIKLANTLKMRAYLNTKNTAAFEAIAADPDNYISSSSDDFEFNLGTQRVNPNSRHYQYNSMYEVGDGDYMNNYYMWLLAGEQVDAAGETMRDPRTRYYFYRKVNDSENQDATTYGCHYSIFPEQTARPAHWSGVHSDLPYCYATTDGYIGRDHMNGEGTPPDGPVRTSYGVYPSGGAFDYDQFEDTRTNGTMGGLGAGIYPILLSSHVGFMKTEVAAMGLKRDLFEAALTAAIDKVIAFSHNADPVIQSTQVDRAGNNYIPGTVYGMYGDANTARADYIAEVMAVYDATATDAEKLDLIAKQHLIALWGNGLEAYNMYRRTGLPSNMAPALESQPGGFPYSLLYPEVYITRNAKATQRSLSDRVFWNVGGPDLY